MKFSKRLKSRLSQHFQKKLVKNVQNSKGMTLIEIMIVIAIVGGLMAILGQNVFSRFGKAKVNQAKIQLREVSKALELYAVDCGSLPGEDKGLNALVEDPGDCDNWGPEPYLKKIPKDPWNAEIIYENDGSSFSLLSLGADRREGGKGNDKDISSDDI